MRLERVGEARGERMADAVALMARRKISELPVVDGQRRPVGLIDVTDVVALFPQLDDLAEPEGGAEVLRGACQSDRRRSA